MTRDETKKILMIISAVYPNFKPENWTVVIDAWKVMLAEYEYTEIEAATRMFVLNDSRGFAPSVGQIIDCLQKVRPQQYPEAMEAWALVSEAISNSLYESCEEFNRLPEIIRKVIRDPVQLKNWAVMDSETVQSVIQSNFLRAYSARLSRQQEIDRMPGYVRDGLIESAPIAQITEKETRRDPSKGTNWTEKREVDLERLRKEFKGQPA